MIHVALLQSRYEDRMIPARVALDETRPDGCRAKVVVSMAGDTLTAMLSGDLDRLNADDVMPPVRGAVGPGTSRVVIDVAGLRFIDSSGIHALLKLQRALEADGIDMRLAAPDDAPVRRTLEFANVAHLLDGKGNGPVNAAAGRTSRAESEAGSGENGRGWDRTSDLSRVKRALSR